jgi:hemerythrin-like domain-containing protein
MLRDASLIPLSHQHHNALALCVLMRRALAEDASVLSVAEQAKKAIDRYELELTNHFDIEEQVLFPECPPMQLIPELIADHRRIEALVATLLKAPTADALERFCVLLVAHIRREEGDLFQQIQETLSRADLDRIGSEIERRAVRICL